MKLKNVLLTGLSFVLVAAVAIGGTLAYLTSTDDDVNVMTLGNVSIEQFEMEREFDTDGNVTGMKTFTQGQPLMPAVVTNGSGNEAWAPNSGVDIYYADYINGAAGGNGTWQYLNNVMDKFVFVKNTGKTDAYYRTIIAYEAETTVTMKNDYGHDMIHFNINGHGNFDWVNVEDTTIENVEINGVKYNIMAVVYKEVLKPGEISRPSLLQVGMDQIATNEYVAQFGDTFDILVLSQAVQTAGFDNAANALNTAFGEINSTNAAEWFSDEEFAIPAVVNDADGLIEALEGGKDVILTDNVKIDPANMSNAYGKTGINVKNGQTIDGNGNTIDIKGAGGTWDSGINTTGGLIKNINVTGSFRGIFINHNSTHSEPVILENVTIDGTTYTISCDQGMNQTLTATGSTFKGWTSFAGTLGEATFIDCYFGEGNGYAYCRPYAPTTFVGCDFEAGFEMDARATVTFENCTIGGVALTADNLSTLVTSNVANATVK